jgi:hypothetical protein
MNLNSPDPDQAPYPKVSPWSGIQNYFRMMGEILLHPAEFFRKMPLRGGMTGPLGYALITHWLGTTLGLSSRLWINTTVSQWLQNLFSSVNPSSQIDYLGPVAQNFQIKQRIFSWFFGVGPTLLDPFYCLFSTLWAALFVYVGARILVSPATDDHPQEITFESALRITCYSLTPSILLAVPLGGPFIGPLYGSILTIIGVREVYRVGTGRSLIIALFPKLLFFGIIIGGILAILLLGFKFLLSAF